MATLVDVLNRSAKGDMADLVDLCEFALDDDLMISLYNTRLDRVVQADWVIAPSKYGDRILARMAADFVNECVSRIENWDEALRNQMHMLAAGYACSQNEWAHDEARGINYVRNLEFVHAHRFRYDEQWHLRLYDYGQRRGAGSIYGEALDPRLWTIHQYQAKAGYRGVGGLMRSCLVRWMFRRWADKWRVEGIERHGAPFVYAEVPAGTPQSVREEILAQLGSMVASHVAVVEAGGKLVIEASAQAARSHEGLKDFMQYTDESLTRAWLGASDFTGTGAHGSQAAVNARVSLAADPRMVSDGISLSRGFSATLFKQLIMMNPHKWAGYDARDVPVPYMRLRTADDEIKRDYTDLAAEEQAAGAKAAQPQAGAAAAMPNNSDGPQPAGGAGVDVAKQALNGAQVSALIDIASRVQLRQLGKGSAIALVMVAVPSLSADEAARIVGEPGQAAPPPKPEFPPGGGQFQ